MALQNTDTSYGGLAKVFHWATVLLILTVIPLGIIAHNMAHQIEDPAVSTTPEFVSQTAFLFSLHKTIGLTIFFLALLRIIWAIAQPKPLPLASHNRIEQFAAATVHWLLYASLIIVPLTGWIHHAATAGFAPIWWPFGQSLPFVPKDDNVAHIFASLHIIFERVLVLAFVLHVAGALKHHFFDRDSTLRRMLPGQAQRSATGPEHGVALPLIAALAVYITALGTGTALGLFALPEDQATVAELEQAETGWQVDQGTLGLTITQFGSQVQGSFADWTAAINFEESDDLGPVGDVEVTIAIGSLTLGSVTGQALGADFFNAAEFPTAVFDADLILGDDEVYTARGTLTLKGQTVPVELPFTMTIDGDTAQMTGRTTLNRMNFNIGESMVDESSLAFDVLVNIELTATQVD
ncbi:cytochrome b/b6 domain-containing protein [Pseudaestuariivita rosea]|uniref:cytochrome b/b6 domain-containing protein n=1 Tax=Pseudaestuariivita rosea TaxID=2763263 RepID=UPI001ABAFA85|nr:cytochrome b/b6 domain-containing protein [Pseudaestuariivita rosea]